jgi:hypothetical protein
MFKPKDGSAWQAHPVLAAISNDDPELAVVLAGIKSPVVSINQMIEAGPHRRTLIYNHIKPFSPTAPGNAGLLRTWTSMGRRQAFAHDYAKYLLALKIIGAQSQRRARGGGSYPDTAAEKDRSATS